MRIATLHKVARLLGYAWSITFFGGIALNILGEILWERLTGTPFRYEEVEKVWWYIWPPLLGLAFVIFYFADFLNKRRLKKYLVNASAEEMAFHKMMQDDGYECTNADKYISAMQNNRKGIERGTGERKKDQEL